MLTSGILSGLLIVCIVLFIRALGPRPRIAKDRPELPYKVFTKEFDIECHGRDLDRLLDEHGADRRLSRGLAEFDPEQRIDEAKLQHHAASHRLRELDIPILHETSAFILVDQSGSVASLAPNVFGEVFAAAACLEGAGAQVAVAGFTTAGWRGGNSRDRWKHEGQPSYPGRLCDLVHVIHKDFSEAAEPRQFAAVLQPDTYFENVDGEALEWASSKLKNATHDTKILLIISDGAPVDDSTLMENGPGFLWRHLECVCNSLQAEEDILLGAVGLNHRVDTLYSVAAFADGVDEIASGLIDVSCRLLESGNNPNKEISP